MPDYAPLKLFNSLTRQLETFQPVHKGEARVYSCGPTVYNYPHIGNMRAYVFADVLGRTLSFKGYKLTHVINITDVGHLTDDADAGEDKLEKAAAERAQSIWDIARHFTEAYWADVKALNIRQPAQWSIATDYVPAMIEFAKSIADKHCYELGSGLYFDVATVANYGRLARISQDAFNAAAESLFESEDFGLAEQASRRATANPSSAQSRIGDVDGKRNKADFAIWRKTPPGETRQMEWDSPWGQGAPGWHLECSVMSEALLGFPFDIHTGGIDHREIHHPNEIAQNQAFCHSDASGANLWMHNNFLVERSGKMSKSAGEFLRLQLLIDKGYHPLAYRMMCLQAHYRSELEFSWEGLGAALVRLKRLNLAVYKMRDQFVQENPSKTVPYPRYEQHYAMRAIQDFRLREFLEEFERALSDDLNTPIALTIFEETLALKNVPLREKLTTCRSMMWPLGLRMIPRRTIRIRPLGTWIYMTEIEATLAARKEARAAKDFAASDALRDELAAKGVEVMDGDPLGWEWRLGD